MTATRHVSKKHLLDHWGKGGVGMTFEVHGRRWLVTAVNRERRITEVTSDDGHNIFFGSSSSMRLWLLGDWRYV